MSGASHMAMMLAGKPVPPLTVQATLNASGDPTNTTHSIALPAGIVAGEMLIIQSRNITGVPSTPAGWTSLFNLLQGTVIAAGFWKIASGGETAVSITWNSSVIARTVSYRISGHNGQIEVATAQAATQTTHDPPNLAPSWGAALNLWIATTMVGASDLTGDPANYGNFIGEPTGAGNELIRSGYRFLNASSENPGVFTSSAATNWIASTIAVRPAV